MPILTTQNKQEVNALTSSNVNLNIGLLPIDTVTPTIIPNPDLSDILDNTTNDYEVNPYEKLMLWNIQSDTKFGTFKYLDFVEYFDIVRTDGRPIWNIWGEIDYLDIIDYDFELYLKTSLMDYDKNGAWWQYRISKIKNDDRYSIGLQINDMTTEDGYEDYAPDNTIHDLNQNVGSGSHRNDHINPAEEYYRWGDGNVYIPTLNDDHTYYLNWYFAGNVFYETDALGGEYEHQHLYEPLTNDLIIKNRDWSNELLLESDYIVGSYLNNSPIYFSNQPFVAKARNLDNYIKIDNQFIDLETSNLITSYQSGHKFNVSTENQLMKVELEQDIENNYETYYVAIDTLIPDVALDYPNIDNNTQFTQTQILTDENGFKYQSVDLGVIRNYCQIGFDYYDFESPEYATVTFNNETTELLSGQALTEEGTYQVIVHDLVGNRKIINFNIDKTAPSHNLIRLQNDENFIVSKWFNAEIPYSYTGGGTYSFLNYQDALNKAKEIEEQNQVTSYYLDNVNYFTQHNLVANGNIVQVGDYYHYKSIDNPELYVYYFDLSSLNEAIEHYASEFITEAQYNKFDTSFSSNYYGIMDSTMYDNLIDGGYIINGFMFEQLDINESNKIYYDYLEDVEVNEVEFYYNTLFEEQVNQMGLYQIREVDQSGLETIYNVFLDEDTPSLKVSSKISGGEYQEHYVTIYDIPVTNELTFYYEKFEIVEVIESDKWWTIEIVLPDYSKVHYSYLDELPELSELGIGNFEIAVYDRLGNSLEFEVFISGQASSVDFNTIDNNSELEVRIRENETFNMVMDLDIYKNNIKLDFDDELLNINASNLNYTFNKGGVYKVIIQDNFGRNLTYEFKFEKELPLGILAGVEDGGTTNSDVSFSFNNTQYFAEVLQNDISIILQAEMLGSMTTYNFTAEENSNDSYKILLYDINDLENFNQYTFYIDTTPPEIILHNVVDGGTTSSAVYATFSPNSNILVSHEINEVEAGDYISGNLLSLDGVYRITALDEFGNVSYKTFTIDTSLNFEVYINDILYNYEGLNFINQNVRIENNEELTIEVTKDDLIYNYNFGEVISLDGYYKIKIFDEYNNAILFEFVIDNTAPTVILYGVENYGVTNTEVYVDWQENLLNAFIYQDGNSLGKYLANTIINKNANYEVYIYDLAGNETYVTFEIDKKLNFDINVFDGGIASGEVSLIKNEPLEIEVYFNGELNSNIDILSMTDEGNYTLIVSDLIGNEQEFLFEIVHSPMQELNLFLRQNVSLKNVTKDDEIYLTEVIENYLNITEEGFYFIEITDEILNKDFTFEIEIDTTPPTCELVGAKLNETTTKEVKIENISADLKELNIYLNGNLKDYDITKPLIDSGNYRIELVDFAGNETVYEFRKEYGMNMSATILLGGLIALGVVLIAGLIISSGSLRVKFTKK